MTGYTVHTGSTEKFSEGWDVIFAKGSRGKGRKGKQGVRSERKATSSKKTSKSARKKK